MSGSSAIAIDSRDSSHERDADVRAAKALGPQDSFLDTPTSRRGPSPFENGGAAPASVSRALAEGGAPLAANLREDFGQAFGADFSDVRIHSGEAAERSAREVGAPAYSVGKHVVLTGGLESPSAPEGRKVLGHELAHVQQAREEAGQPMLRRVGFLQSIARFFGGGTYEKGELVAYLNWLEANRDKIQGDNDSDNKARAVVAQGMHKTLLLETRAQLIGDLRDGHVAGDDQDAILAILSDATPDERFELMRHKWVQGVEKDLGGDREKKYFALVEAVDAGGPYPVSTDWRFGYEINGASKDRDRLGIALDDFSIRPADTADPIHLTTPSDVILKPGETTVLNPAVPHPRDRQGQAFADYALGALDGDGLKPVARATEQPSAAYGTIGHDITGVNARLTVDLESQVAGADTKTDSKSQAVAQTTGEEVSTQTSVAKSQENEVGVKRAQKRSTGANVTQSKGATVGAQNEVSEEKSDATTQQNETTTGKSDQTSHTKGTGTGKSDSTATTTGSDTTTIDFTGKIDDAKFKAEIEQATKGAPLWKKVAKWGLKKALKFVKDPRAKLLEPLIDLIDTDSSTLVTNVDGTFSLKITLTGESKRTWEETVNTHTDSSSTSESDTTTKGTSSGTAKRDGTEKRTTTGSKATGSAEAREDVSVGVQAGAEVSQEVEAKQREGRVDTQSKGTVDSKSVTKTQGQEHADAASRSVFRAVIKSSKLSFDYVRRSATQAGMPKGGKAAGQ